ncbi:MAG TPA: hypothetical protein VLY24_26825 [Bryobacteraceae bacterium]|nr:hypothetical protein [Bryobacteraceae bacterium]
MIYTCYDMIRDCREGRAEGWRFFASNYVPVIRRIVAHYGPERSEDRSIEELVEKLRHPESSLFQSHDPAPERWFVAELRQQVLALLDGVPAPGELEAVLDLALLSDAMAPLTVVEKQAVWFETMRYESKETATLLRMEPRTVEKIRGRAAEILREKLDTWRITLLADNGRTLGRLAAAARTSTCPAAKAFLNVLDGRSTWTQREDLEGHVSGCWHCIDHSCRMAEVVELVRGVEPLPEEKAAKFHAALGIPAPKKKLWQRWSAAR